MRREREISNFPLSSFSLLKERWERWDLFLGGGGLSRKEPLVLLSSSSSSRVSLSRERERERQKKSKKSTQHKTLDDVCAQNRLFIIRDDEWTTRETRCATTEVDEEERKRNNVDSCFLLLLACARVSLTRTRKFLHLGAGSGILKRWLHFPPTARGPFLERTNLHKHPYGISFVSARVWWEGCSREDRWTGERIGFFLFLSPLFYRAGWLLLLMLKRVLCE